MIDTRLELKIGTPVAATDGFLGSVQHVIVSPAQRRVVGLVVRTALRPHNQLIVPAELIADATDQCVALRASRNDLLRQPSFDPAHYLPPAAANQRAETRLAGSGALDGSTIVLQSDLEVWATDGRAGHVGLLLLNEGGEVRHFVMGKRRVLGHDVIVPVDWISAVDEHRVRLAVERAALEWLPPYRPDSIIAADVGQALWSDEVIRALDFEALDVSVQDGVVTLSGYSTTPTSKARAERAACQVPGVLRVQNEIAIDGEVVTAVAQALGRDERTREARIVVHAERGVVTLYGEIETRAVRAAAEEVAGSVSQVRGVINSIQTPGVVVDPVQQRVLQPRIGQYVYAEDGFLGHVERVIVSGHGKRVTAFVVRGIVPTADIAEVDVLTDEAPSEERWLIIPIEVVKDMTAGGVLLTISGADAMRRPDLNPNDFVAPDARWESPYPYTHADVLLDRRVQ